MKHDVKTKTGAPLFILKWIHDSSINVIRNWCTVHVCKTRVNSRESESTGKTGRRRKGRGLGLDPLLELISFLLSCCFASATFSRFFSAVILIFYVLITSFAHSQSFLHFLLLFFVFHPFPFCFLLSFLSLFVSSSSASLIFQFFLTRTCF